MWQFWQDLFFDWEQYLHEENIEKEFDLDRQSMIGFFLGYFREQIKRRQDGSCSSNPIPKSKKAHERKTKAK